MVDAFLAAARGGDFDALVAVLDPDVVIHTGKTIVRGADAVAGGARAFARIAALAQPVLAGDTPAAIAYDDGGEVISVALFTIADGRVLALDIIDDPDRIAALELAPLDE